MIDNASGMQFGPYQILYPVGAGGMTTVYRAIWLGHNTEVALKVLAPHLGSTPEQVERFKREAEALARLQHPYILPLIDYGTFAGQMYIVLQLVEGGTLAQRIKAWGALPLAEIQKIMAQVGGALGYAHQQGFVHRDVKPGNVLINAQGDYLLTDFGIAKFCEATSHYTKLGETLGTPAYMSPEQAKGETLDQRSDIYSLGVMLYELATGRVPFAGDTPWSVFFRHITEPLPPPRTLNPGLLPALEAVIQKALAKHPQDRYQNTDELLRALQTVRVVNFGPSAPLPPPATQTQRPTQPAAPQMTIVARVSRPDTALTIPVQITPKHNSRPQWRWAMVVLLSGFLFFCAILSLFMARFTRPQGVPPAPPSVVFIPTRLPALRYRPAHPLLNDPPLPATLPHQLFLSFVNN